MTYLRGREEGTKERPCAVVAVITEDHQGPYIVTVLPITHSPPSDEFSAIEVPHETKMRLGLDDGRSWVVITEANRFRWPGPDLRIVESGDPGRPIYGLLPRIFYNRIRDRFDAAIAARLARVIARTE